MLHDALLVGSVPVTRMVSRIPASDRSVTSSRSVADWMICWVQALVLRGRSTMT